MTPPPDDYKPSMQGCAAAIVGLLGVALVIAVLVVLSGKA